MLDTTVVRMQAKTVCALSVLRSAYMSTASTNCLYSFFQLQVFDAGDYFGIMQVEEVDEEEEGDEAMEDELKKKPNPGNEPCFKVIVTNENGIQASNPDRWVVICELVLCPSGLKPYSDEGSL